MMMMEARKRIGLCSSETARPVPRGLVDVRLAVQRCVTVHHLGYLGGTYIQAACLSSYPT